MAAGGSHEDASGADVDLYAVLGLNKECSDADLRLAYRRLAMTWHPDRCSASGSAARVEEAKERFQNIQSAYSVLSDSRKRILYDVGVGVHENQDEQDASGMGDFLDEMAEMMSQATPVESFEELQQLFVDMFHADLVSEFGFGAPAPLVHRDKAQNPPEGTSGSAFPEAPPPPSCDGINTSSSSAGSGMPSTPGPGLSSGLSSKGSNRRRREDNPRAQEYTSTGGRNMKQRPSTSHGVLFGRR